MKTRLLLFIALLVFSLNIFAQNEYLYDDHKLTTLDSLLSENSNFGNDEILKQVFNDIKTNREISDLFLLDSTVYYEFNSELDSFATEKLYFFYDNHYNVDESVLIRRENQNQPWENISRVLTVYNEQKLETERVRLEWNDESWVNLSKYEFFYNSNNNETEQSNYDWDIENEIWVNSYRVEYSYNEQNLHNEFVIWIKDYQTNILERIEKYEMYYNAAGSVIDQTVFRWDKILSGWTNYGKTNTFYGPNVQSNDYYSWDSTVWKLYKHSGYRIDSLIGTSNNYFLRNDTSWVHTQSGEVFYNSNGSIIGQETYRFQESHNYWFGSVKFDRLYDENDQYDGQINYDWNFTNEEWIYDRKSIVGHNENQIFNYYQNLEWSTIEDKWNPVNSTTYYFKNVSSLNENLSKKSDLHIYPNPCNNLLTIETIGLENVDIEYQIYSISGRLIKEGSIVASDSRELDVSNLNNGFYLLKVKSDKKQYSNKFVKF